jgi:ketosteroid isomerase-like protein
MKKAVAALSAVAGLLRALRFAAPLRQRREGAARSGDLGYVYGTYELKREAGEREPTEVGNYVHVWKREAGGDWRVVLDITNPVPLVR